jgi:hypothetical protein
MTRPQVIINLHGGLVQDVFCSVPDAQVLVVDWDVEGSFPGEPGIVDVPLAAAPCQACVSDFPTASLNELAGTDVEAAIDAACQQGVLCDQQPSVCP